MDNMKSGVCLGDLKSGLVKGGAVAAVYTLLMTLLKRRFFCLVMTLVVELFLVAVLFDVLVVLVLVLVLLVLDVNKIDPVLSFLTFLFPTFPSQITKKR